MSVIKEIDVIGFDMDRFEDLDQAEGFGSSDQIYDEDQQILYVHEEIYDRVLLLLYRCEKSN